MAKHFLTIIVPKNESTPELDPRHNIHPDFDEAFDWVSGFIQEEGHPAPERPLREAPTAFELRDVVVEIWICNAPTPYRQSPDL